MNNEIRGDISSMQRGGITFIEFKDVHIPNLLPRPVIRSKGRLSPHIEIKKGDHFTEAFGLLNRVNQNQIRKQFDPVQRNKKREMAWNSNTKIPSKEADFNF